jgi:transposase-like protein
MSGRAGFWRELIEAQAASGLSVEAYCRQRGVSTSSFFAWRRRLAEDATPRFLPVRVAEVALGNEPASPRPAVELERADGVRIRVFDGARRQTIVDVLAALETVALDGDRT